MSNGRVTYTERSLALACTRGREAIVKRFHPLLVEQQFTEQQWRVMRVLFDFEPMQLAQLCRLSCIHKVSMTRIIRTLMARKFVSRIRQPDDARAYIVSLTPDGKALMGEMSLASDKIYRGITRDFGAEKTRTLLRLLKELGEL